VSAFALSANGRITFPDDEVQARTAESLWERGSFAITPLEAPILDDVDFGTAPGRDGRSYGIFGQGLALLAAPVVPVADAVAEHASPAWRHTVRTNLGWYHARSERADWRRLVLTSVNVPISALGALAFAGWLLALGMTVTTAAFGGLALALGTLAWTYSSTFMSEPLSLLLLTSAAACVAHHHRAVDRRRPTASRWLWGASALTAFACHVHILNLTAIPAMIVYASRLRWPTRDQRRAWAAALTIGAAGVALLGLSQWLRFGSAFETGRYATYGHWTLPFEGLAAFVISPGRSVLIYAPPVALGLILIRRGGHLYLPAESPGTLRALRWAAILMITLRLGLVACRSDWHGGWSLGPRYALPILPFALLPLAFVFDRADRRRRIRLWVVLGLCAVFQGWMAMHASYEHMFALERALGTDAYMQASHWSLSGSAPVGFARLDGPALSALFTSGPRVAAMVAPFDAMSAGALRLGLAAGVWRPFVVLMAVGAVGLIAAGQLARSLRHADLPLAPSAES
jgi:hypothetical protein